MNDVDVIRLAAGAIRRKAETVIKGCLGKPFDQDIAAALVAAGRISLVIDMLDEIANGIEQAWEEDEK